MADTLRASGSVSLAVMTSRVLGVVREAMFAALFGTGALADAYQVAFRIPNLLRDLFAEGALSSAFVPTFAKALRDGGTSQAYALANLVMTGALLVTGSITLLGTLYAPEVIRAISADFGGDVAKASLAADLTMLMMPFLSVISVAAVWMGMLNAQQRFAAAAYAPAAFNVANIVVGAGLLAWTLPPREALYVFSVGTLAAGVVQALVQLPALWRLGYRPFLRFTGLLGDPGMRRIVRLMAPAVLGLAAVQISIFVNTRFAAELGDGPVSQISYAFRLFYLPIGVFGVAIATVTTAKVSAAAAAGDRSMLVARTLEGLRAAWMLTSASAVGLFVLAEPVVALIFERGAFGVEATKATAAVLQAFAIGLLPYSLVKVLAPAFYSVDRARYPLFGSLVAVATNVTFNALTYEHLGASGIAFGTTLGTFANVSVLRLGFRRVAGLRLPEGRGEKPGARVFLGLLTANAVMAGLLFGATAMVERLSLVPDVPSTARTLALAVELAVLIPVAGLVYLAVLRAFSYPGVEVLWSFLGAVNGKVARGMGRIGTLGRRG